MWNFQEFKISSVALLQKKSSTNCLSEVTRDKTSLLLPTVHFNLQRYKTTQETKQCRWQFVSREPFPVFISWDLFPWTLARSRRSLCRLWDCRWAHMFMQLAPPMWPLLVASTGWENIPEKNPLCVFPSPCVVVIAAKQKPEGEGCLCDTGCIFFC